MRSPYKLLFPGLFALCLAVSATALWSLFTGMDAAFSHMLGHLEERRAALVIHVATAALALVAGAAQFIPALRLARPSLHRWLGRLYLLCALCGGVTGLILALNAVGGPIAGAGLTLLALLWCATSIQAGRLAVAGRLEAHPRWATRAFALTCAAIAFRAEIAVLSAFGFEYASASQIAAWASWAPVLALLEMRLAGASKRSESRQFRSGARFFSLPSPFGRRSHR